MAISIRKFTDSSGSDTVVMKVDGSPAFWPNVFTTIKYRNRQKAATTIEKVLRTVGMCYQWAKYEKLDLDEALTKGRFISIENADSLAAFLKLKSDPQQALIDKTLSPSNKKIVTLERVRGGIGHQQVNSTSHYVNAEEAATRIRTAAEYLKFHQVRRLGDLESWSEREDSFKGHGENVIAYLKQLAPRVKSGSLNEDLEGLSAEECEIVEEAFQPNSASNPFRKGINQHRNYLIWRFMYETGMRRGELAGLKVKDVNYSEHRVVILESKTHARTVPISQDLSDFFHEYVMEFWGKIPHRNTTHGYLITNKDGGKLGVNTINQIFTSLRNKVPNAPKSVSPHTQRRTWNDRFSEKIDSQPESYKIPPEQELQIRNRLMGWSTNSQQGLNYAKRHLRRKADEIAEELVNKLINKQDGKDDQWP